MAKFSYKLNFTTSYGQFYIYDKDSEGLTDSPNFWTEEAFLDRLAVEEGILGVSIENDEGIVNCELELLDKKQLLSDFDDSDHIVEANIEVKSGFLQIESCPSDLVFETELPIGNYRVRVYSKNLKSGYSENPNDSYKIEIWKDVFFDRHVLKKYIADY